MVGLGAAKLLVSGLYDLPERSYSSIILLDCTHIFSYRMAKYNCVLVKTLQTICNWFIKDLIAIQNLIFLKLIKKT